MKKATKIFLSISVLCMLGVFAFADRGGFIKKDKPRLNIETHGNLKNSVPFNLRSGLKYQGSQLISKQKVGNSIVTESVVSYKKGNVVYLIPYKQRIATPEYSQKDGYKLIIRSK